MAIQLVLAGPIFQVDEKPVLREVSYLATARWGSAAVASSTDVIGLEERKELLLCRENADRERESQVTGPTGSAASSGQPADSCAEREPDPNRPKPLADWRHAWTTWSKDVLALAFLYVAFLAGTCWILRRRDPSFARSGR